LPKDAGSDVNLRDTLKIELEFEREIAKSRELSLFRRNPTTWELLLLLSQNENGNHDGLHTTIESTKTQYLGSSALLKFIRERRDDGVLQFLENKKKSKRTIQVDMQVLAKLSELLAKRNHQLIEAARAHSNEAHGQGSGFDAPATLSGSEKDGSK